MSTIAEEIANIKEHLGDAYDVVEEKNGTVPDKKNMVNLADAITSIPTGGEWCCPWVNDTVISASYPYARKGFIVPGEGVQGSIVSDSGARPLISRGCWVVADLDNGKLIFEGSTTIKEVAENYLITELECCTLDSSYNIVSKKILEIRCNTAEGYSATTTYNTGDIIVSPNASASNAFAFWKCLQDNTLRQTPKVGSAYWELYEDVTYGSWLIDTTTNERVILASGTNYLIRRPYRQLIMSDTSTSSDTYYDIYPKLLGITNMNTFADWDKPTKIYDSTTSAYINVDWMNYYSTQDSDDITGSISNLCVTDEITAAVSTYSPTYYQIGNTGFATKEDITDDRPRMFDGKPLEASTVPFSSLLVSTNYGHYWDGK